MVAAAGLKEGLRPARAFGLLAFVIAGAFAAMLMKDRTDLMQLDPSVKPRDFLVERAREIIRKSGYSTEGGDSAFGFDVDIDQLDYLQDSSNVPDRSQQRDRVGALFFWYRASPRPLEHMAAMVTEHVTASDPPLRFSGEALVRLDSQGFLRTFEAIPPQQDSSSESGPVTNSQKRGFSILNGRRPNRSGLLRTMRTPEPRGRVPFQVRLPFRSRLRRRHIAVNPSAFRSSVHGIVRTASLQQPCNPTRES